MSRPLAAGLLCAGAIAVSCFASFDEVKLLLPELPTVVSVWPNRDAPHWNAQRQNPDNRAVFHSHFDVFAGDIDARITDSVTGENPSGGTSFPSAAALYEQSFGLSAEHTAPTVSTAFSAPGTAIYAPGNGASGTHILSGTTLRMPTRTTTWSTPTTIAPATTTTAPISSTTSEASSTTTTASASNNTSTLAPSDSSKSQTLLAQEVRIDTDLRGHPDVLWYPRWDSWASVKADWSTYANTYGDAPNTWPKLFYTTAPEFGGIPAGRFESVSTATLSQAWQGAGTNIMQMRKYFNQNTKQMLSGTAVGNLPLNDIYLRYCIMVESDVWAGINETGMKLPGLVNPDWGFGYLSTVMWHSIPGETNPYSPPYTLGQPIRLATYLHGRDLNQGSAYGYDWINPPTHSIINIQPDRWTCIEQHMVMNSMQPDGTGNSDGLFDLWVDDELVLSFRDIKIRDFNVSGPNPDPVEIQQLHGQIYHGGMNNTPIAPIHYRVTGVALAKKRIGMPKRVD